MWLTTFPENCEALPDAPRADEVVIVIHGILMHPVVMRKLAWRIKQSGFTVLNWGYATLLGSNADHGRRLLETLKRLDADPNVRRIHLVTHSMGGIVTRSALRLGRPEKLGRIVMLTPPNHGSWVSTIFGPLTRWFGWKTLDELSQRPTSYVNQLPQLENVELGIIAGALDHLVWVKSTHLECQTDHLTLRELHTTPIFRECVFSHIQQFLLHGRFDRSVGRPQNERLVAAGDRS